MRHCFYAKNAIVKLFKDAQAGSVPFPLDDTVPVQNYNPGDFRFDGVLTRDGIYVYFDDSDFERSKGSIDGQGHTPKLNIDIYISEEATVSTGTGTVEFSVQRAQDQKESLTVQIWDAVNNKEFLRLLNEKIGTLYSYTTTRLSFCRFFKAQNMGTLRLTQSRNTVMTFRYVVEVDAEEKHVSNPGALYTGDDDQITPYRREEDYP